MTLEQVAERGLVMLGCGKMGGAMLDGWLAGGLPATSVHVIDPNPSDWLQAQGVSLGGTLPQKPAVVLLAVKPQIMSDALPAVTHYATEDTLFVSVAAGLSLAFYQSALGPTARIIRCMPNTPAAVGQGITALIGNAQTTDADLALAETLLAAIGQTLRLDNEDQIDAVTGVSGSGPAYVFHMIETLAAAGEQQGLPPEMAMTLAKATVAGSGALAQQSQDSPSQLRINVTSPNGTTQAGLQVLMDPQTGLPPLIQRTVAAATNRSKELGRG